jgi:hypothetical protein
MLIAIWPIIILLAGLVLWVVPANPTVKEIGRIAFFCGLLVTTLVISRQTLRIG